MHDSKSYGQAPLACRLSEEQQRLREVQVRPLLARVQAIEDLPNGCRLNFGPSGDADDPNVAALIRELGEFVARERACCPFADYGLAVGRDGGDVTLTLRSSPQAQPILDHFTAFVRDASR